ncbi:MAG: hypothetical protein HY271_09775 [Deltaproteobacteria bacterium]|nr:hypothetical protein [Deltaproteobacteria bacterium]
MPPKKRRESQRREKPEVSTQRAGDPHNIAVAKFSDRVVFGDVSEERRRRLVRLTPDPSDTIASQHPEIQEMMERATALLFDGLGFTEMEEKLMVAVFRRRRFSAFNALMRLLDRIPRVEPQLQDLARRGVPRDELLAALLMAQQELQREAALAMPVAKRRIGQQKSILKGYAQRAVTLELDRDLTELINLGVDDRVSLLTTATDAIDRFVVATRHLLHQTKTPLVRDVRIRVAQVLSKHAIGIGEAFGITAKLLGAWHPERFRGLTALHVRVTYQRRDRRAYPPS